MCLTSEDSSFTIRLLEIVPATPPRSGRKYEPYIPDTLIFWMVIHPITTLLEKIIQKIIYYTYIIYVNELKISRISFVIWLYVLSGFKWAQGLENHMSTHANEKLYLCDQCDFLTASRAYLAKHTLKHESKKEVGSRVAWFKLKPTVLFYFHF